MHKKYWPKRMLSGILGAVMAASVAVSPFAAVAADTGPDMDIGEYVASLPELEAVKTDLDADEVVSAGDYEVAADTEIDLKTDFTGIEIPDKKKVTVTFYEAKNEEKENFSTSRPDTYKATYYAVPANNSHPSYRFQRNVIVKETDSGKLSESSANAVKTSAKAANAAVSTTGSTSETAKAAGTGDSSGSSSAGKSDEETDADEDADADASDTDASTADADAEKKSGTSNASTASETSAAESKESTSAAKNAASGSDAGATTAVTEDEKDETTAETAKKAADESAASEEEVASANSSTTATASETAQASSAASEDAAFDDEYGEDEWTVSGIIKWATEQEEISLAEMGVGETVTFDVPVKNRKLMAATPSTGTMKVEITKGEKYHYNDYDLGHFWTHPYYVKFGDFSTTAYCIEPSKSAPDSGTYTITKLSDAKILAKVIYYGNKSAGDEGFFAEKYPDFPTMERFIITHLAAGYANEGDEAFRGTNDKGKALAMEMYNYCKSMPEIPDVDMEFSDDNLTAYVDGTTQRTKEVTFKADVLQTITFKLPSGVKLHNATTGKTSAAGASVEIPGGTKFYFIAPLTQAQDTGVTWHSKMTGSVTKDYSAYTIKGGSDEEQDLALVFGEAVGGEKNIEMDVTWVQSATLTITKTNKAGTRNLSGAVFGVYSDSACTSLIVKMPATDSKGTSTVTINANGTVYLKELTPPAGFKINAAAVGVSVSAGKTTTKTIADDEILGSIKVTKTGDTLTGATTSDSGTKFTYSSTGLANATFSVTAGADITSADGTVVYKKGASVGTIKTNSNGEGTLGNLHMGTYVVTETGAPSNYVNKGESKTVTLKAGSDTTAAVIGTAAFTDDRQKVEVTAVKQDKLTKSTLSGAVFGLYADEDIKNTVGTVIVKKDALIGKVTTGVDGKGKFTADLPIGHKFYVKELVAPDGYKLNGSDTYRFTTTYTNDKETSITFSHTFTNDEILGKITIYKEGEVLSGADVTDSGTAFKYETRKHKGATFAVYAAEDITSAGGRSIYKKGALVKDGLVTGNDGSVTLDNLYLGTYTVKETSAPANFVLQGESKNVKLSLSNLSGEVAIGEATIKNDRQKAKVTVTKQDDTTHNPLSGGIYGLYAAADIKSADGKVVVKKDTFIEKVTTGSDGTATFKSDLPLNNSYYVKEMQAPKNYYRNEKDIFTFSFNYTNEKQAEITFTHTFENERVDARIDLTKVDKETGSTPQGDANFLKATYGLFAREDIVHPDGKTGVLFKKDAQVATLTTDKNGKAFIENLYLGKYYIKELVPSEGYLLDETEYDLDCAYEGDLVKTVKKAATSKEQVIKQPFQVIKAADNDKTDADLLKGAGFSAYLISSLKTKADGSYDFTSAKPIVLTKDGGTEMFTDEKGYAVSIPIPYGKYIVRETTTPHNFTPVDDFKVTITENHPSTPQTWRVLLDDEFEAKLKIIKKDDETKKAVLLPGTEFRVYDVDHKKYVEQVTTYPSVKTHTSYFTDENGYLILPNRLKIGNYRVEEVNAPNGYILNHNAFEVAVDTNTAYQMEATSGDVIIEVEVENTPVKGNLTIEKTGEVLTDHLESAGADSFGYEMKSLAGAEFAVYADEDVYTPDHQKDENGDRIRIYEKDSLVASVVTDEYGMAEVTDLPLGTYRVEETKAPYGFVLNTESQTVTFTYADQETPIIYQTASFTNDRQKVEISVEKQDIETGKKLEGAVFGLYAAADIKAGVPVEVDAADIIIVGNDKTDIAADNDAGNVTDNIEDNVDDNVTDNAADNADADETDNAADSATDIETAENDTEDSDSETVKNDAEKSDSGSTSGEIADEDSANDTSDGSADTTDVEPSTEVLTGTYTVGSGDVLVEAGTLLAEAVSDENGLASFNLDLPLGQYYVIEHKAPDGYVSSTEETLFFDASYQGQDVPVVKLESVKKNEPTKVEFTKSDITTAEEIDGAVLTILTRSGEVIERWTTVKGEPHMVKCLTAGESYVLREETAPYGYLRAEDAVFTVKDTGEIQKVEMKDKVPTALLIINKKGEFLDKAGLLDTVQGTVEHFFEYVSGNLTTVTFEVYAAEDIKAADGCAEDYYKKDDLVGTITTDDTGIAKLGDLPVGRYYVVEKETAYGYVLDGEPRYIDLSYRDQDTPIVVYDENWQNVRQKVLVHLVKKEHGAEKTLKGAIFGLYAAQDIFGRTDEVLINKGELIEQKVTDENGEITFVSDLPIDGTYYIAEIAAPAGYATSTEKKEFEFTYSGPETSMVAFNFTFENEPTYVSISKQDVTTCEEIPGAHLVVRDVNGKLVEEWDSTDKPHMIKRLVAGASYTLTETIPANGYATAETITFTVEDTAKQQKVEMFDEVTKVQITKTDMVTKEEIPGAKLTIFDSDGKEVTSWISGTEPHYIEKLPVGTYTLREELAPDGYIRAEDVKFTVKDTGEIQKVAMVDDYTKVQITKTDMVTKEEIPGAKLTVFDSDMKKVTSWTSGKEPHYIEKLKPGTYTLREELAPDGYIRAEDVKFTVEETGEIQKVAMVDDYTKVQITKTDMVTKEEIPGAKLTIFDKDGKKVETWTSGKEPHYIEKLKPGTYMLREELAPDGYLRAEDVKFTVEETGEIQKVAMVDDYTKVQISKTDMVTKEELPGAKLTVFDSNNETVESWTSGKEPHMINRLKPGKYTLREVTAPKGYEVAEDVTFTVKETGEIQKVAMVDAPEETKKTTTSSGGGGSSSGSSSSKSGGSTSATPQRTYSNPQTGDNTNIVVWILLLILGGILFGSFWYVKREMDKENNV